MFELWEKNHSLELVEEEQDGNQNSLETVVMILVKSIGRESHGSREKESSGIEML